MNFLPTKKKDGVFTEIPLAGHTLRIVAVDMRSEYTGVHGKLLIYDENVPLAWNSCNIERTDNRTPLAREAHKGIIPDTQMLDGETYSVDDLKKDLGDFCLEVWEAWVKLKQPSQVFGDPTKTTGFMAHPHVVEGGGTILFGSPGAGKSMTAMLMAIAVDAGINDIWGIRQAPVLYVNLERGRGSMERRLGLSNRALGLDPNRPLYMLNARGFSLRDVYDQVTSFIDEKNIEFVILDSISRAGMGDLNENKAANYIMDRLNSMSATWLGIGHPPRSDSSHLFGSTMFDAAADMVLGFKAHKYSDTKLGVRMEATKVNDIAKPDDMYLTYSFDTHGLSNISLSKEEEHPSLAEEKQVSPYEQIQDYLMDYGASSADEIAKALEKQRPNVVKTLKTHKDKFIQVGKNGKKILYGLKSNQVY